MDDIITRTPVMNEAEVTSTYFVLIGYSHRELGGLWWTHSHHTNWTKLNWTELNWRSQLWTSSGHFNSCDANQPLSSAHTTPVHWPFPWTQVSFCYARVHGSCPRRPCSRPVDTAREHG